MATRDTGKRFWNSGDSCCSVTQSYPTLCDLMDYSMPAFPVLHHLPELAQTLVHQVSDAIQTSRPLSSPAFIFPNIRAFSNELALHIRWPKYWTFSVSPSNEYSGLISFRIDWFDLLAVQWTWTWANSWFFVFCFVFFWQEKNVHTNYLAIFTL